MQLSVPRGCSQVPLGVDSVRGTLKLTGPFPAVNPSVLATANQYLLISNFVQNSAVLNPSGNPLCQVPLFWGQKDCVLSLDRIELLNTLVSFMTNWLEFEGFYHICVYIVGKKTFPTLWKFYLFPNKLICFPPFLRRLELAPFPNTTFWIINSF